MMDRLHHFVRVRGDDRTRINFSAMFPQAGECQRTIIGSAEVVGQLCLALGLPFEEATCRYQAAAILERRSEGRFFSNRLSPSVIEQWCFLRVLSPGGQQSPTHQRQRSAIVYVPNNRNLGRWRNVVLGFKHWQFIRSHSEIELSDEHG